MGFQTGFYWKVCENKWVFKLGSIGRFVRTSGFSNWVLLEGL